MNAGAPEWKPNVGAASWTPGGSAGFTVAKPSPAPAPAPAPVPDRQESTASDIDENDPLWQVVLKIAEGDRTRALKMINNPDSLTQYPEVVAILASGDGDAMETDDWEKNNDTAGGDLAKEVDEKNDY
mmetsp:Transcript_2812/g.6592  ORF Transcript_2812/g.6592 Transcript_2812/m.6592 type:complete len:128 (+) Transcript_2812:3482-3865(+)